MSVPAISLAQLYYKCLSDSGPVTRWRALSYALEQILAAPDGAPTPIHKATDAVRRPPPDYARCDLMPLDGRQLNMAARRGPHCAVGEPDGVLSQRFHDGDAVVDGIDLVCRAPVQEGELDMGGERKAFDFPSTGRGDCESLVERGDVDLDEPTLKRILVEPKNALVKQYHRLFEMESIAVHGRTSVERSNRRPCRRP
jgi:hypothetical protein